MDREALDFRGSATMAAPRAEQTGSTDASSASPAGSSMAGRPIQMRERLYGRDRQDSRGRLGGQADAAALRDAGHQNRNVQTVTIQSILKGAREAIIDFDGAAYRLRITRNHRLILTK